VQKKLGNNEDRSAYFAAALTLAWPDGHCESVEGRVSGALSFPSKGDKGFGYDPIFVADGHDLSFGEMEPAEKHQISHRADAFSQLVNQCFNA
jgi:XTP/dITP diphosphohydrolase